MQVRDPQPAGVGGGRKDEVRPGAGEAANHGRARAGRKFRGALERRHPDSAGGADDISGAAALAGWFRSEAPPRAPAVEAPVRVSAGTASRGVDRILIGAGPDGAQARIRIATGALAGTEIQLSSIASGRIVEAQLLTHASSSRQTLSVVLDEIRSRLRDKRITLSAKAAPPASGKPQARGPDGADR